MIDNNKNNKISIEDEEPTVELEPLSEEDCAAMMLAEDRDAGSDTTSEEDTVDGNSVAANLPILADDAASEIQELRDELKFRVELNGILQHGIDQQREQCRRLAEKVESVEKARARAGDALERSQKQLSKIKKKLAEAKSREKALLQKLKKRGKTSTNNAVGAEQEDPIEALRKENQVLKDSVSDLETRMRKAGDENARLLAEVQAKDARIDDYDRQLVTLQSASGAIEHAVPGRAPDVRQLSGRPAKDHWVLVGLDDAIPDTYVVGDGIVTIGSSPDSDIQLQSQFISRHHAELVQNGKGCILGDLNSTNGTFINSRRIKKRVLRAGDIVTIGKHRFRYESRPAESIETS